MKRRPMHWIFLIISIPILLYCLLLLPGRWTDLGVWFLLLLALPPLLVGLFPGTFSRWMAHGFGKAVKIALLALYALFFVSFGIIGTRIVRYGLKTPEPGADAVIVLGCAIWDNAPSPAMRDRLTAGLAYAKENPDALVVVSGGQGPDEPRTEAAVMAEWLLDHGLEESRLRMEDASFSTYENFVNSKALLDRELGEGYRVVFVSNRFHILRCDGLAESCGLSAEGLGIGDNPLFIPIYYMREYLVTVKYTLFGAESMPFLSKLF